MLRSLFVICFLPVVGCCLAQTPAHDLLRSLDRQRFTAQVQKDSLVLNRLLANDLIYTHSNGLVETKQQFIHNLVSGRWNYQSIDTDSVKVRFYGSTAILTGRARVTLLTAGQPTPVTMVYTDVWHERQTAGSGRKEVSVSRWQLISWAASRLPN